MSNNEMKFTGKHRQHVYDLTKRNSQGTIHSLTFINPKGYYYVNSDSLNDFGKIEFSPDNENWYLL